MKLNMTSSEWQKAIDQGFSIDEGAHWKPVHARLKELGFEVGCEAGCDGEVKAVDFTTLRYLIPMVPSSQYPAPLQPGGSGARHPAPLNRLTGTAL